MRSSLRTRPCTRPGRGKPHCVDALCRTAPRRGADDRGDSARRIAALLLTADALGIGVPFMVASLGLAWSAAARERLQRVGPIMQRLGGGLLVVLGPLLVTSTPPHVAQAVLTILGDHSGPLLGRSGSGRRTRTQPLDAGACSASTAPATGGRCSRLRGSRSRVTGRARRALAVGDDMPVGTASRLV